MNPEEILREKLEQIVKTRTIELDIVSDEKPKGIKIVRIIAAVLLLTVIICFIIGFAKDKLGVAESAAFPVAGVAAILLFILGIVGKLMPNVKYSGTIAIGLKQVKVNMQELSKVFDVSTLQQVNFVSGGYEGEMYAGRSLTSFYSGDGNLISFSLEGVSYLFRVHVESAFQRNFLLKWIDLIQHGSQPKHIPTPEEVFERLNNPAFRLAEQKKKSIGNAINIAKIAIGVAVLLVIGIIMVVTSPPSKEEQNDRHLDNELMKGTALAAQMNFFALDSIGRVWHYHVMVPSALMDDKDAYEYGMGTISGVRQSIQDTTYLPVKFFIYSHGDSTKVLDSVVPQ